ncbi:hypothetical protein TspCOW1_10950 [Thiohalobacter sp. COW1]|uniref:phosphate/phosphite/phosphonate ABC transporter substrate-binding protein n=1 Tax=Thiohalobacter sp. COW1 TaxID=2795687 RepID=UPI00191601A9|nr:phosphate/phosphite/phosphonate ABC transporter substrate-binding protein [Thiohalobacter sp. COW1]BCO30992.1 hypothetical protein TspCOW1_10950 [Thiohalobacter sp. COW1]
MRFLLIVLGLAMLACRPAAAAPGYQLAIVNPASPSRLHAVWEPLRQHLSQELDAEIELVFPKGIDQVEKLLGHNEIDFVYLNSYLFYLLKGKGKLAAVAQMRNLDGMTTSQGSFIVRADSGIRSVDDLRGRKLALISPLGAGAYLAPRAYLRDFGMDIHTDLDLVFTGDLKKSVYAVLLGDAAATTMCAVSYKILEHKLNFKELSIIDSTRPFPEPLVAASTRLGPEPIEAWRRALLKLSQTESGRAALQPLADIKVRDFIEYDPALETLTRNLMQYTPAP